MSARNLIRVIVAAMLLTTACNYTDGPCYRRGESDVGAGVGGGVIVPGGVGGYGDAPPDPRGEPVCNAPEVEAEPTPEFGKPANAYIPCRAQGLDPVACAAACEKVGAYCVEHAVHPYKSTDGVGDLTWCKNGWPTTTCTYTYPNTDSCSRVLVLKHGVTWVCAYAGGG